MHFQEYRYRIRVYMTDTNVAVTFCKEASPSSFFSSFLGAIAILKYLLSTVLDSNYIFHISSHRGLYCFAARLIPPKLRKSTGSESSSQMQRPRGSEF